VGAEDYSDLGEEWTQLQGSSSVNHGDDEQQRNDTGNDDAPDAAGSAESPTVSQQPPLSSQGDSIGTGPLPGFGGSAQHGSVRPGTPDDITAARAYYDAEPHNRDPTFRDQQKFWLGGYPPRMVSRMEYPYLGRYYVFSRWNGSVFYKEQDYSALARNLHLIDRRGLPVWF